MRYSFRLAQLLGHSPDPKRRPGIIKAIVEHTGLDRHKVAALLRNDVKYLPLDTISLICGYLIDHGFASPDQLPGALFGIEPESFWEMLARRTSLHICLGTRQAPDSDYLDDAWIVTADSLLLGVLLNEVSTLGGTAKYYPQSATPPIASSTVARAAPHPDEYVQWLVLSPEKGKEDRFQPKAWRVCEEFDAVEKDKALVCLGSVKSNPVIEIILARAFGATPFESQDHVQDARERRCPVWFRFRAGVDPPLPSCAGGLQLSKSQRTAQPGIYYERADGSWDHVVWDDDHHDAGLILYQYAPALGRLEMVVGGFSSRSTRLLAQVLTPKLTSKLWPPPCNTPSLQTGIFIVKFKFAKEDHGGRDILSMRYSGDVDVIALDESVIARRIQS